MNEIQLQSESRSIVEQSETIIIFSKSDNAYSNDLLKIIKKTQKNVKEFFKPEKDKANELHKQIVAKENIYLKPLLEAESNIKSKISTYLTNIQREKEEEERKRREEADRLEKERLAAIAQKEKELKEAEGYLTEEEKQAELDKLKELEKKDFTPVVEKEEEVKPQGQIVKKTWTAELIHGEFAKIPDKYKLPNMQMLNALARAEKDSAKVPGVVFKSELNVSSRIV